MNLVRFNSENIDDCGKAILSLVGSDGNEDNIFTGYNSYGNNIPSFTKKNKEWKVYIKGCIVRNPRDITRQISFNCRTQKVSSMVTYQLQGSNVYNSEQIDEIERIFHSKHLYINGVEVQFYGGPVFEPLGEGFANKFRLNAQIAECEQRQIFGCNTKKKKDNVDDGGTINTNEITFGVPQKAENGKFYDDTGGLVATSYEGLLDYYKGLNNVISVEDVNIGGISTDVEFAKVFTVKFDKEVPDPFFFDKYSPSNKVYGLQLSDPNDYNELSRGLNKVSCQDISISSSQVLDDKCLDITLSSLEIFMTECEIEIDPYWKWAGGENSIGTSGGNTVLNISVYKENPDFGSPTPNMETGYTHQEEADSLCNIPLYDNIPSDAVIIDMTLNGTSIMGDYDPIWVDNDLTLDPCLPMAEGDEFKIFYNCGSVPVETTFTGVIGYLRGACMPTEDIAVDSTVTSQMPAGSTLRIAPNGEISWSGDTTYADENIQGITLTNININ